MLYLANITNETVGENDTLFYGSEGTFHSGSRALQGNVNMTSWWGCVNKGRAHKSIF